MRLFRLISRLWTPWLPAGAHVLFVEAQGRHVRVALSGGLDLYLTDEEARSHGRRLWHAGDLAGVNARAERRSFELQSALDRAAADERGE